MRSMKPLRRQMRLPRASVAARRILVALVVGALVVASGGGPGASQTYAQGGSSCTRRPQPIPGHIYKLPNGHYMKFLGFKGPVRGRYIPQWQDLGPNPPLQNRGRNQNRGQRPSTGQRPYQQTGYSRSGNVSGTLSRTGSRGSLSSPQNPGGNKTSSQAMRDWMGQMSTARQLLRQGYQQSIWQGVTNAMQGGQGSGGTGPGGGAGGVGAGGGAAPAGPSGDLGTGVAYAASCNQPPPPPPCLVCNPQPPGPPIYAPDLYLYPTRPMDVRITLEGTVTASHPAYGGGWIVRAQPDGLLSSGGHHLFYDAVAPAAWQTRSGWVVAAADWPGWIRRELRRLGLNARETSDFVRDWATDLPPAPYYLVAPQPRSLVDAAVGLRIEPPPETLYRLWLYVVPLKAPVTVAPPEVPVLHRRGFTAVEWGVVFPPGVAPPCVPEVGGCP